jgi:DNA-binding SARP family transcriptional activator/tetratricopeptide (TPR) repeat protein
MTATMLVIRVIGELEVELAGVKAELPGSRRARALLAWLAIHPGRHPRSRLAALLWPDVLDSSARASLRSAIWALRSATATATGPGPAAGPKFGSYLVTDRESVMLGGDGLVVDLLEARRLTAEGRLEEALALHRGELLHEFDDEWVFEIRSELEDSVAMALGELADRSRSADELPAAVKWARRRVALRPLDEDAARELMVLLADSGDTAGALQAYGRLRERLSTELGIPVSPEVAAVAGQLRALRPADGRRDMDRERAGASPSSDGAQADGHGPERVTGAAGGLPRMVGRAEEFAELRHRWLAARAGSGTVVLLDGEGGIGKTRLTQELRAAAGQDGALTFEGSADGPGGAPFALWTEALGELVAETGRPPDHLAWTAALAGVVPAFAPASGAPAAGAPAAEPALERVRFFEAVVELLSWAARDRPLVLTLEDLHLADISSLELIAYVGRRVSRMPVLILLTRRRLPPRQDLDAVLGALRSRGGLGAEIGVRPLPATAVRELAQVTAELPVQTLDQIVALATGSPLIAVETARAVARRDGDWAAGLGGAARSAIATLSGQARLFVEFAAAAGRDLDRAEVASLPLADPARAATEALGSGLFTVDRGAIGFRHALLREAVYQDLPDPLRTRLHGAFAQLLRKRALQAGARRGRRAAEIARHLRLGGQDELAAGQLAQAAADARRVAAMTEAASFLAEALEIEPDDADLLVELAEVEAWRGLPERSDTAFAHALEQIAPLDAGALISAWLRRGRWLRGAVCNPRESRRSYRSALDVLDRDPGSDPAAWAEALAGMAWAEAVAGDPAGVDALLAEADHVLGGQRASDLLTHDIGVARGHALIRAGRFGDSFGPLIAAAAAAGRAGRPDMAYSCLSNAAGAAACAGEFERALDFADRCVPLVVPNGLLRLSVYVQSARAAILRRLGRLAEASLACDAAAGYAERVGLAELDGLVHHERGLLALAAGDPDSAAAQLRRALDLDAPVSRAAARLLRAEALAQAGHQDLAEAELRAVALEPVTASDFPGTLVARMARVQGLIASARGDLGLAERRLAESARCWQRAARTGEGGEAGAGYVATLIDLGRPPISSLVEPARELAAVSIELAAIRERGQEHGERGS